MKKMVVLWVALLYSIGFSQSYHADYKTVNVHSPFRWVVADSTARVALTVTARDTQKLCFQIADTTIWLLSDDSPKNWAWVSGKKADSLWIRTFQAVTAGITRINTDSSDHRILTADSAGIDVYKGAKTFRDTNTFLGGSYFAGIGRFAGTLYSPQADIDSLIGNVKIGGTASVYCSPNNFTKGIEFKQTDGEYPAKIAFGSAGGSSAGWGLDFQAPVSPTASVTVLSLRGDKSAKFAGSCTTSTINTGNGDCEVYPHITGSFPCTLKTSDVTVQQIGTAYWTKIGNVFTCSFPYLSGTSNSTLLRMYCSIPYKPKQMSGSSNVDNRAIPAVDNGSSIVCFVDVFQVSGFIVFQNSGGVFTNSGIKSVLPFSVTYITED